MNNRYIIIYTTVMTLIVAVVLAFVVTGLKPIHDENEAVFKKRDILNAVKYELPTSIDEMSDADVAQFFESSITQVVLDANGQKVGDNADAIDMKQEEKKPLEERKYPLYIYKGEKNTYYLAAVRGNGLWDKIWATVAIKDDFNTIAGISFDHVTETAGLGAEIKDNEGWKKSFIGKELYNDEGEYVSISVVKGGIKKPDHQVDAIAGATITSNGVTEMMDKGMKIYLPYFESLKK